VCQISEYPSRGGIEPTEINFLTSADWSSGKGEDWEYVYHLAQDV
jgi:hypothetical protein